METGVLAELANQHTQTPKAVVKLQEQPLTLDGQPSTPLQTSSVQERAALRMGKRL
ncbi:hypothetical protein ZHAWSFBX_CDS_0033 [Agrobacterium phage Alfirin]|nr:hypothetical protein ZHAWSFBX_CDS_0033 [Agrobacterium phage Alfirin]